MSSQVLADNGTRMAGSGNTRGARLGPGHEYLGGLEIVRAPVRVSGRLWITRVAMYCLVIFDYELPQTWPLDQQLHHGDDCLGPPLGASGRMVSAATAAGESRGRAGEAAHLDREHLPPPPPAAHPLTPQPIDFEILQQAAHAA